MPVFQLDEYTVIEEGFHASISVHTSAGFWHRQQYQFGKEPVLTRFSLNPHASRRVYLVDHPLGRGDSLAARLDTHHHATGILRALLTAYLQGLLESVQEIVCAELFDDFLEMAGHLLQQGYKDPAAVIGGGVIEQHLRKLCQKHAIPVLTSSPKGEEPRKASIMNDDLARAGVYSKLEQKQVTAWLDIRNKAAHGHYAEYDAQHVEYLLAGLKQFVTRFPA